MANYDSLISVIQSAIYDNSEQDITGAIMQQTLVQLVNRSVKQGSLFKGKATPTTNPNNPDANVFYVANQAGIYSNFNSIVVNENEVVILTNQNGSWEKFVLLTMTEGGAIVIDDELSESSSNPVRNSVITAVINNLVSRVTTLEAVISVRGIMQKTLFQSLVPNSATEIHFLKETGTDLTGYTKLGVVDDDAEISVYRLNTVYKIVSDLAIKADTCFTLFSGYTSLQTIDFTNFRTSIADSMWEMFYGCGALTSLNLSNFNTENVTNMRGMFFGCDSLTSLDLSSFNTENVTTMQEMFYDCRALTSINVSSFNTANVTDMSDMFGNCAALTSIDIENIENFNTSNVTDFEEMFTGCSSLTSLFLEDFITDKATTMRSMFIGCSSLTGLSLLNFDTSKVTDMRYMFKDCTSLEYIELSNFNTSKVTHMTEMFKGCTALETIESNTFDKTALTTSTDMFSGCTSLVGGNGTTYDNNHIDATYARVDGEDGNAGYFTAPQ